MNDRHRGWISFGVIVAFSLMLAATSRRRDDGASMDAKPTPAKSSSSGEPETMVLPDVDVMLVTTKTGCDTNPATAGCKLLRDFDQADAYADLPATKIVWFGESYGLGGAGEGAKEPFFVNVENRAAAHAGAARTLIPENPKEKKDAESLLVATKAGRALPNSEAAKFMIDSKPPGGLLTLVRTKGRSYVLKETPPKVYLRRLGDRVLILEYSGSPIGHDRAGGVEAMAWIAETWAVK